MIWIPGCQLLIRPPSPPRHASDWPLPSVLERHVRRHEVLLIPHNDSHSNVPLVTTIMLMVVFGGASIGLREWFASRRRHAEGRDKVAFRQRVHELLTPAEALGAEAHVQPAESAD